jgi:exoribonuclease R
VRRLTTAADLGSGLAAIRRELEVPGEFPPDAIAEAEAAARRALPGHEDRREIELFTIDPPGSLDLDQAVALERRPAGYRIHYAIADVAAFVDPGGALDAEAHRRALTRYLPDGNAPLHPRVLSEGAASLLPGEDRPATLWTIDVDADGRRTGVDLRRALVRSRERFDYATVQARLDAGTADERLLLLREIGGLLQARERDRGAINLPIPEQEVVLRDGAYALAYRGPLPIEDANAQISLLTGMAAAELMLEKGVGVLRTLPAAPADQLERLRRVAAALGIAWPDDEAVGDLIRRLDPLRPREAALLEEAASLLRGAGYAAFHGAPPEDAGHAGLAAPYAHVTAPLRRLVDRYATAACLHDEPPDWLLAALHELPAEMAAAGRAANAVERAVVDLVEALLLHDRVGETFPAMVIDRAGRSDVEIQLADPAVRARCAGDGLAPGDELCAHLSEADPERRVVRFVPAAELRENRGHA